jgi:N-acetyl-alpha-D-glucosaminyl L-malate synthase BshA
VTAVSEFLRRMTLDEFQIHNEIEAIPNFVDLSVYRPESVYRDRSAFAAPGQKILLHISNMRPVKRVLDTVRILERVTREVPAVLLMVGEGPERASAQALARRLGLKDQVRFLGPQNSIEEIAGLADVFLLPSELESFGLSALEAMACGVPVVGSDAGGLPEVVQHAETGFLLPVGDVDGMAARCLEILKDEERRRAMGHAARRRAAALFNADRIVSQYERFYEKVLSK